MSSITYTCLGRCRSIGTERHAPRTRPDANKVLRLGCHGGSRGPTHIEYVQDSCSTQESCGATWVGPEGGRGARLDLRALVGHALLLLERPHGDPLLLYGRLGLR